MEYLIDPSSYKTYKTKIIDFLAKWEEGITVLTIFSATSAIGLGFLWVVMKEMTLLYLTMGFSGIYFLGKKFWKFRPHGPSR